MPGKGTRHRSIRVSDELWLPARAKAQAEGTNLTAVIQEALRRYIAITEYLDRHETEKTEGEQR